MASPKSVLVAEDNDFVRMQVVKFLQDEGYTVHEAVDGVSALALMKTTMIDVIVLDVRMVPMDGFEMIKAMHSQNLFYPVIMVTGDQNPDLLAEAARWNVSAILLKPVQKDRLIQMVSRALQRTNGP